jgi:hypothetical protein
VVVYKRGRVRQAILAGLQGLLILGVLWLSIYLIDPHGIAFSVVPLIYAGVVIAMAVMTYRRNPWLVRTSYHGLDLFTGIPVRLPWVAISSIHVSGQRIIVTVGDPTTPENLDRPAAKGTLWTKTTFHVNTPEIEQVLADLATRLPYLEIKHH